MSLKSMSLRSMSRALISFRRDLGSLEYSRLGSFHEARSWEERIDVMDFNCRCRGWQQLRLVEARQYPTAE